ncbi:MAG: DMT family transporter [Chloroflexota bacterium]|nr:DMT family transporter [Chloroflexota bacterium]
MRRSPLPLGYLLALAGASMFAWLGPLSRWAAADGVDSLAFVAWRAGVGSLVLAIVVAIRALARRGQRSGPRASRRERTTLIVATVIALVLNLAIFAAFSRVTIAIALLALYTYPAMVTAVALVLGRERVSASTVVALALALGGMAVVVAGSIDPAAGLVVDPLGVVFALIAAACQTAFVTISRDGYRSISEDRAMAVILGGTLVGCVTIALVNGGMGGIVLPFTRPEVLPNLIVSGTLGAAIPSLFFLGAIRLIGGMRTGILMLFEPVVAVSLAAILLGERLRPIQILGAVGVLGAALLLRRSSPDPDRAARPRLADDDILALQVPGGP